MQYLLLIVAIVVGHVFAYIDARPNFDDTGVLAFSIAIACAILSFIVPRRPWLWALAVGIWIPLHTILHGGSAGSLLAMAFAFGGAYLGATVRRLQARST